MAFGFESILAILIILVGFSFYFWRKNKDKKHISRVYLITAIVLTVITVLFILLIIALLAFVNSMSFI
jgi:uncharacterized membrane protein